MNFEERLKNLEDSELIERYSKQYFSEELVPLVKAEFERRNLELPQVVGSDDAYSEPLAKRHPLLYAILLIVIGLIIIQVLKRFVFEEVKSQSHPTGSVMQTK
jgi:hypothetical protein